MKSDLSPKQVARAIGVSESSLKRWCDRGLLPMVRTAGGHRRLPVAGVLDFLKKTGRELAEPQILGLPTSVGGGTRVLRRAGDELTEALVSGSVEAARRIILDLFLQGHRLAEIFDEVVAVAFESVGSGWECGSVAVYEERRACEMMLGVMRELQQLLPRPDSRKKALGGTPAGDPYQLPTGMAALVLMQCGFDATSLGSNIPFESLAAAIEKHRPQLFWLSVSYLENTEEFIEQINGLYEISTKRSVPLVVGGQALNEELRRQIPYTVHCDTFKHLESYLGITSES